MGLEEYLNEYKALTLDIMERVNIDGSIGYLVNERQEVLNRIEDLDVTQSEIKKITDSLNLIKLEEELNLMIKKEKVNIKRKIENLKKMRNANIKYKSIGYVPSRFDKES